MNSAKGTDQKSAVCRSCDCFEKKADKSKGDVLNDLPSAQVILLIYQTASASPCRIDVTTPSVLYNLKTVFLVLRYFLVYLVFIGIEARQN